MKILIDVGHPKNVHIFKHFAFEMEKNKHNVVFSCLDKDLTVPLLKAYNFKYKCITKHKRNLFFKTFVLFRYLIGLTLFIIKEKPDICISQGSVYMAMSCFLLRKVHISLHDTENSKFNNLFSMNLSTIILASENFGYPVKKNHIRFNGSLENAYLHPKYIVSNLNEKTDEKYVLIRFVAWAATHDVGHTGLTNKNKINAVKSFQKYAKVYISSEIDLPKELDPFRVKINPIDMHAFLKGAQMFYGESATMAAESALLGTPSIYIDNEGRGYTTMLEKKYGLIFNYTESEQDQQESIQKGEEILAADNKSFYINKMKKYFSSTINLTSFMIWFVSNYPKSYCEIKNNPELVNNKFSE